ncbi:MAG TPA: FecR family protein [Gammaproteobacteria bacterium]|nr:FecR family protein [Gammaproteobacteria bacterium]
MRWWTGLLLLAAAGAWASGSAPEDDARALGRVVRVQGPVHVVPAQGFRQEPAEAGRTLERGDLVLTGDAATAVLAFRDGSRVALDGGTKLEVLEPGELRQEGGQAFYRIRKGERRGRQVRTAFSVIGVKGTGFLVSDTAEAQAVAMAEGEVAVTAPEGRYKLYREKQEDAFGAYRERQRQGLEDYRREFEDYKRRVRREFVEYTRTFSLGAGRMATFGDGEATTGAVSQELEGDMQRLRDLL